MSNSIPTAKSVARYVLYLGDRDGVQDVDQFKVHKILYFCQCWSLALRGTPLFDGEIQAWKYGPVCCDIRKDYRDWGDQAIEIDRPPTNRELSEDDRLFIESVWHDYRGYSGRELSDITHKPGPWDDIWQKYEPGTGFGFDRIPQELMRNWFKRHLQPK